MSNGLAYLGGILVAILAALFAVPALIDWNGYRGVFEEEASRALGRDVRLGGNVNLRLLPAPYVSFEKMRISDPASISGEPLFRTDSFTMWLAISPMLQGVLQANQVELTNPVVKLAVNEDGEGNWNQLRLKPGALPFVPADVALNSVKITNGEVGLVGPNGKKVATLEAIDGELMADALTGPVRFRGKLNWSGEPRDVRFATASPDPDGVVRFKVSVTGSGTHSSYVLDGRASGFASSLNVEGELSAKIAPDLSAATSAPSEPQKAAEKPAPAKAPAAEVAVSGTPGVDTKTPVPVPTAAKEGAPLYAMTAQVRADAKGFALSDINVTSEGTGPPQLVTGQAQAAWGERTKLDLSLNSRWIDLDAMFGTGKKVVPLEAARGLFDVLMRQLPASSDTNIQLSVDQLNLGADRISNVRIAAVRAGGPLRIRDFQLELPGATKLALTGRMAPGKTAPKFQGNIGLKGQSLSRFLAWAIKRPDVTDGLSGGAFALNGDLKFSSQEIDLTKAKLGIGDTPVMADVQLDLSKRRRLAVQLEGQKIDLARIWRGGVRMEAAAPLLAEAISNTGTTGKSSGKPDEESEVWFDPANADLLIGIKAGAIHDGRRTLRNVEADLSVENGKLAMRQLKFSGEAGLQVELEGEANSLNEAAQGTIRGLIVSPGAAASSSFVDLAGLAQYAPGLADYLQRMTPLRLAGSLTLGARQTSAADLMVDGTVGGGRMQARVAMDGGLEGWRTAPVNVSARIQSSDVTRTAAALIGEASAQNTAAVGAMPGRILLRASGVPKEGLLSFAAIESRAMSLDFNGLAVVPNDDPVSLDGKVAVDGPDVRALLQLAGLKLPGGTADIPVAGTAGLSRQSDTTTLRPQALKIAGVPVSGFVTITQPYGGRTAVKAELETASVEIPSLLSAILSRPAAQDLASQQNDDADAVAEDEASDDTQPSEPAVAAVWPDRPFDLDAFATMEGTLSLKANTLALQPGLAVSNAKAEFAIEPGKVAVTSLTGKALGGSLDSKLTFKDEAAGASLSGELALAIPQDGNKPDVANLSLKYSGRALSPSAVVANMKGEGELKLGDVSLGGLSAKVVSSVAESGLRGEGPVNGEQLVAALREGLQAGQLKIGALTMPVTIEDGNMSLAKVELDRPEGSTTFQTVVELATMRIDSEWRIAARLPKDAGEQGKTLPPVSVVYTGDLRNIAAIEPQISAGALERELTVRKMEHDVDELERLRKEDERRAREEQARLKAERERREREERARSEQERRAAEEEAYGSGPSAGGAPLQNSGSPVDQTPLPPVDPTVPQPQSVGQPPDGVGAADAASIDGEPVVPEEAAAAAQPPPQVRPRKRRRPSQDNWNPFTF